MASTIGIEGQLTVSDSGDLQDIIGAIGPYSATLTINRDSAQSTAWASTPPVAHAQAVGMKDWTIQLNARFPGSAPAFGQCGNVTFANGYVLKTNAWDMAISCEEQEDTGMASTCPEWAEYIPGVISATGSWVSKIDSSTSIAGPTSGSATFRLTDETTDDNTLACSIHTLPAAASVVVGSPNQVRYGYVVNGNITAAGDSSLFPAGALAKPDIAEVVLRAASGKTYTGDAFWTGVNISVPLRGLIDIGISLRGTGALTIA